MKPGDAGDLKENKRKYLCIQCYCLTADDIVLSGEPVFGPTTWAGGGRCSLEAPIFLLCLSPFESLRNPTFVTETSSTFDAVRGARAFIWNAVWQVCPRKQIMCFEEDIHAVLSLCSGPDGKLPAKFKKKKSLWDFFLLKIALKCRDEWF